MSLLLGFSPDKFPAESLKVYGYKKHAKNIYKVL